MSGYSCLYCKTGLMNTKEQYEKHIYGVKHKKKAFQLQAPNEGIEYPEFQRKQTRVVEKYDAQESEFPTLDVANTQVTELPLLPRNDTVPGATAIDYGDIVGTFDTKHSIKKTYNPKIEPEEESYEEVATFESIESLYTSSNARPTSAMHSINEYGKQKKTAAQTLNEVAQLMDWELSFEQTAGQTERYGIEVHISGFYISSGEGENKKLAKQAASANAIKDISKRLKNTKVNNAPLGASCSGPISLTANHSMTNGSSEAASTTGGNTDYPADAYKELSFVKLKEIEDTNLNHLAVPRRYAAFIITERADQVARDGTVVAFGAGDGALSDAVLNEIYLDYGFSKLPGYCLRNFDCLVLARKSLQCFFYNQMLLFFDNRRKESKTEKNFLELGKSGLLRLKQGCRLHLYLSHAPYGDCVESIPSNWEEPINLPRKEAERDKRGVTEPVMFMTYTNNQYLKQPGHIRVLADTEAMEWMSIIDFRSRRVQSNHITMSPTDKLTTWIHIGIQGALLSHLLEPVFLYSIQFGKNYMHQHVSRALLCRVPLDSLQKEYGRYYKKVEFKDPFIERVHELTNDKQASRYLKKEAVCFNWYLNPVTNFAEIVDQKTGCVHVDSPFKLPQGQQGLQCSRLSKVCMIVRLKEVFKVAVDYYALRPEFKRNRDLQGINQAAQYNYCRLKNSARDYRQLKHTMFQLLYKKRYGDWEPNEDANRFDLLDFYELNPHQGRVDDDNEE